MIRHCAETIAGSVDSVRTLVDEFATLARFPASHPRPADLNAIVGGALAPGTVAGVYGSGLATFTGSPNVVPLVSDFQGTQMIVGGFSAPLFFVSGGQLTSSIPMADIATAGSVSVTVTNPGHPAGGIYGAGGTSTAVSSPMTFTVN